MMTRSFTAISAPNVAMQAAFTSRAMITKIRNLTATPAAPGYGCSGMEVLRSGSRPVNILIEESHEATTPSLRGPALDDRSCMMKMPMLDFASAKFKKLRVRASASGRPVYW